MRLYDQNIWGNTASPIGNRNTLIKEMVYEFEPDFCCFQECNPDTSRSGDTPIQEILKPDYTEAVSAFASKNFTPVFYNKNKVEEIDGGFFPYEGLNDKNSKSFTWTLFRDIKCDKRVIIISTHFWWKSEGEEDNAQRIRNAQALVKQVKYLSEKYDVPVIVSGDLNSGDTLQGYGGYNAMVELGMTDVRDTAKVSDKSFTCSHTMPEINPDNGLYEITHDRDCTIDYGFSYKNELISADKFSVIRSQKALGSSDHSPLIFDFELLK